MYRYFFPILAVAMLVPPQPVQAQDEASAKRMLDADAAIKAGVFSYQVYPFKVSYSGTLNKGKP